jgi:hypothetical protein
LNLSFYFGEFRDADVARWTFGYELADASRYLDGLPGDPYVYFYSDRWSFDYETRRYLAPSREGEDRSEKFGTFDLAPDRSGDVVYLFLSPYQERADEVERAFASGTRYDSVAGDGAVRFSAYMLPEEGRHTEGQIDFDTFDNAPTPPGGDTRDAARRQDLAAIQQALEQYRREHGSYPDTKSGTQSVCVYPTTDAGCSLETVMGTVPVDPLGDPATNGYWYASNGATYTIWAQRESDQFEPCLERPYHLRSFDSLLCIQGP